MDRQHILLRLDSYDDLFSDFDPRPLERRSLSDDFVAELKKAVEGAAVRLTLQLPRRRRRADVERAVVDRIRRHFHRRRTQLEEKRRAQIRRLVVFLILGPGLLLIATALQGAGALPLRFLTTLLEPAGWFMLWSGLDLLVFDLGRHAPDRRFYAAMSEARIGFESSRGRRGDTLLTTPRAPE
jgi:hypothetical protein